MSDTSSGSDADQISQLTNELQTLRRWNAMSQSITTALLENTDEEEALFLVASSVCEVAEADAVLIVLPSLQGSYICEIAHGEAKNEMIGTEFPPEGRAQSVLRSNRGMIVPSMERLQSLRIPKLSRFGPALYVPMSHRGAATGVIILFRNPGKPEFTDADLKAAAELAAQATLALRLSGIRHAEDRANQLEERQRIARDLHDLAIQQLFATSLQFDALQEVLHNDTAVATEVKDSLEQAQECVADSIRQIRHIVNELKDQDVPGMGLVNGLRYEASLARRSLGFAPSLIIRFNNEIVASHNLDEISEQLADILTESEIADILAVTREGLTNVARHAHATEARIVAEVWTKPDLIPHDCHSGEAKAPLRDDIKGLIRLQIIDDGIGIGQSVGRHSGLANMAARASIHFGMMHLENRQETSGTVLNWCIPLDC